MNVAPINTQQVRNSSILNSTKSKNMKVLIQIYTVIYHLAGNVVEAIIVPPAEVVHLPSLEF